MSHVVTIETKVRDAAAVAQACKRLGLPAPVHGEAELFSAKVQGLLVHLPGWMFPIVINLEEGALKYDNFEGKWGHGSQLDRFLQIYAVEKTKLEARQVGRSVQELALADGSIKLQILEAT